DHAQHDGQNHDLDDRPEHGGGADFQPGAGQQVDERGRDYGCQQGGDGGDGNRQGDVAARQVGHHVGGGASGAASHQNDANGNFRRQRQHLAQQPGQTGHDDELAEHADQHGERAAADFSEVVLGKRQTHAEHDDAQQRHYVRADPFELV